MKPGRHDDLRSFVDMIFLGEARSLESDDSISGRFGLIIPSIMGSIDDSAKLNPYKKL